MSDKRLSDVLMFDVFLLAAPGSGTIIPASDTWQVTAPTLALRWNTTVKPIIYFLKIALSLRDIQWQWWLQVLAGVMQWSEKGLVTIKTRGCGKRWDLSRQVNIHMECCNSFISLFTTKHTFCLTPKQAQCWFTAKSEIEPLISPGCYVHSTSQS